jgi:hypothetical protein
MLEKLRVAISRLGRRVFEILFRCVRAARFGFEAVRLQAFLAWRPGTRTPPPWDHVWDRFDDVTGRLVVVILAVPPLTFVAMWLLGWLGTPQLASLPLVAGCFILATQFMRYRRFVCPRCGRRFMRPRRGPDACQHCGLRYRQRD